MSGPIILGLGVLELLVGAGAVIGGGALAIDPSGAQLHMPLTLLNGSPFQTYLIPGLLLCFIIGGTNVVAGWLALRRLQSALIAGILAGAVLVGWITTQLLLIGYVHPLQPIYLFAGLVNLITSGILRFVPAYRPNSR